MTEAIGVRFRNIGTPMTFTVSTEGGNPGTILVTDSASTSHEITTLIDAGGGDVGLSVVSKLVGADWTLWFAVPDALADIAAIAIEAGLSDWPADASDISAQWLYRDHDNVVTELVHATGGMVGDGMFMSRGFYQNLSFSPAFELSAGEPVGACRWTNHTKTIEIC